MCAWTAAVADRKGGLKECWWTEYPCKREERWRWEEYRGKGHSRTRCVAHVTHGEDRYHVSRVEAANADKVGPVEADFHDEVGDGAHVKEHAGKELEQRPKQAGRVNRDSVWLVEVSGLGGVEGGWREGGREGGESNGG